MSAFTAPAENDDPTASGNHTVAALADAAAMREKRLDKQHTPGIIESTMQLKLEGEKVKVKILEVVKHAAHAPNKQTIQVMFEILSLDLSESLVKRWDRLHYMPLKAGRILSLTGNFIKGQNNLQLWTMNSFDPGMWQFGVDQVQLEVIKPWVEKARMAKESEPTFDKFSEDVYGKPEDKKRKREDEEETSPANDGVIVLTVRTRPDPFPQLTVQTKRWQPMEVDGITLKSPSFTGKVIKADPIKGFDPTGARIKFANLSKNWIIEKIAGWPPHVQQFFEEAVMRDDVTITGSKSSELLKAVLDSKDARSALFPELPREGTRGRAAGRLL